MTDFFTPDATKRILRINGPAEDPILNDFAKDANRDLENFLIKSYIPIPSSSEITADMTAAANYDVAMLYMLRAKNFEGAAKFEKLRDERRELIKKSIKIETDTVIFFKTDGNQSRP